jgi:hypothetical protein
MVVYAPYVAAIASLSSVYHAIAPSEFGTAPICHVVTATVTEYATARPTTNPHGHGGPYYNPHNDVPLPFEWPGKPAEGETHAPSRPSIPYAYGGPAKNSYEGPAWIPKGVDKLLSSISSVEQCGNSQWGLIDCPHLSVNGLPGTHSNGSHPLNSAKNPHGYPPYPTATGAAYHSANATKTFFYGPGSEIITTGISTPTADPLCATMPDTGVTRTYDMHVAYQTIAPDGVTRNGLTVNGQFPGPLVEANWYVLALVQHLQTLTLTQG